jgi:hypothetical protein
MGEVQWGWLVNVEVYRKLAFPVIVVSLLSAAASES